MILYFGSRYYSSVIPEGSVVTEEHIFAQIQAKSCHASGSPKVFFIEVGPEDVRFVNEIGYLRKNTKSVGWHRVGR